MRTSGRNLRRGFLSVFVVVALAMLATFYSVVTSLVDHAEVRRTTASATIPATGLRQVVVAGAVD